MDENTRKILADSNRIINKLQLLSVYFEEEVIYKIYLRTQVIHKLFENNPELDVNKLELYHLQFTASVIDLLKKIKTTNEKNVSLLYDEIQLNQNLIDKINATVQSEQSYTTDKQRQSSKMNLSLRRLYEVLSDDSVDDPFSKNIHAFSAKYLADFFHEIPYALYGELTQFNAPDVYRNSFAVIQRKLMGQLCKFEFKSDFQYGLKTGLLPLEVYKFTDNDRYFLFSPTNKLLLFFDPAKIETIDMAGTLSKKTKMVRDLVDRNNQLKNEALIAKTFMPDNIKALLTEDFNKIADLNFLQNLSSFDVQANILKSMLNTDNI